MPTLLVTGAAGFIASKVCEFLLADGHTVVGIDNLNDYYDVRLKDWRLAGLLGERSAVTGNAEKLKAETLKPGTAGNAERLKAETLKAETWKSGNEWRPGNSATVSIYAGRAGAVSDRTGRFTFRRIDLEDRDALDALFREFKFDAVFNLAARAGVRASMENPYVFLSTNTEGTLNVLESMRRHGVSKQVLASTSSLYAGCPMPWNEEQPVNTPLSPYAASKKAAELMAYSYHKLYGLDTTVVRYFTVFGPAGRPDMSVFRFIKWIDEGRPLEVFGDGSQSRDFTYVDDIARGTILAAKPLGYEIVNLGGGRRPITLQTVIGALDTELGKKAHIEHRPFHVADIKESWADIDKAARLLDWRPEVSIADGLRSTVQWYVANRAWLKDVKL